MAVPTIVLVTCSYLMEQLNILQTIALQFQLVAMISLLTILFQRREMGMDILKIWLGKGLLLIRNYGMEIITMQPHGGLQEQVLQIHI